MNDERITHFASFSPHDFSRVIRHNWWKHYLVVEDTVRLELEIWLCRDTSNSATDMLKIKCFQVRKMTQGAVGSRFELPLHLGVKLMRHWQWEGSAYAFFDSDTGEELFNCQWFEVGLTSSVSI
jgi:hypothetical protein